MRLFSGVVYKADCEEMQKNHNILSYQAIKCLMKFIVGQMLNNPLYAFLQMGSKWMISMQEREARLIMDGFLEASSVANKKRRMQRNTFKKWTTIQTDNELPSWILQNFSSVCLKGIY